MARTWQLLFVLLLMYSLLETLGEENGTRPWNDDRPAYWFSFKMHIDAGKEDCYFQYVHPNATFTVNYQLLKGGEEMCGFVVRGPNGEAVHPLEFNTTSTYTEKNSQGGYFSVCIDNQYSRFAGKLVTLFMSIVRYDVWKKFTNDLDEMNMNTANFTRVITTVKKNVLEVQKYQFHSRSRESIEYSLLSDNNTYIVRWSLVQMALIAAATTLQVVFVKKLFEVKNTSRRPGM